ncbi:MAG: DUF4037 domain-containing protein, partial [Candidatus Doudnabacteria bacterium]|nr:DUF4037 domain-containing protein [Candidatus Doudnabacteria bacterium]
MSTKQHIVTPVKTNPEKNTLTVWEHPEFERMPSEKANGKPEFINGLQLNRGFFEDVVRPLMKKYFPELRYSAALTGHGSDVLGYDNESSTDHNWGPRMVLFFRYSDFGLWSPRVDEMLRKCLPYLYKGFSTNFTKEDPNAYLRQVPEYIDRGDVNHLFALHSIRGFLKHYLAFDRDNEIGLYDWLTFPEQNLLEVTAGEVYHDGLHELKRMRERFSYYPRDIWLYALRVQWGKIHLEEQFQARTGDIGDELGSSIAASKMVEKIMKMAFLLERKYAPYIKWLGTAFERLKLGQKLKPILLQIEREKNWEKRQDWIT